MSCVCVFAAPLQALPVVESYAQLLSEDDALALRIWVSSAGLRVRRCGAVERDFTAKLLSAEPSAGIRFRSVWTAALSTHSGTKR